MQHIALVAIINANHEVLLLKRPSHVHCPNVWSFPGGKLEQGEAPEHAATRELQEETALQSKLLCIGTSTFNYQDKSLFFHFFTGVFQPTQTIAAESQHQWLNIQQLHTLNMPEANQGFIDMLKAYQTTQT